VTDNRLRQQRLKISVWACIAAVVCLAIWAYLPALDAPFIFDDEQNIIDSPAIRWTEISWENLGSLLDASQLQSRPVANLSFALDYLYSGLEPRGFHRTNVLIHLAVGAALFWLCLLYVRVTHHSREPANPVLAAALFALVATGIFLLHPLNTQAVTYVVQRMASLATLFTLLAFASYLMARYRLTRGSRWWYLGMLVFWLLGLGAKEIAVLFVPVVILYEICFFRSEWQSKIERALGGTWSPSWTVVIVVGCGALVGVTTALIMASSDTIGLTADFPNRDYNGIERMMTQARVQVFHLSQLIWPAPARLNLDHDFSVSRGLLDPWTTLPAILLCILLVAAAVHLAARHPRYGFPFVAYAVFHMIEAGPVGLDIIYEHRMYLPATMLVMGGAVLLADAGPRARYFLMPSIVLLSLVFAFWTHERNIIWADPIGFHGDMAKKSPNLARAQHNFALALHEAGRNEEALPIIERAIELDPTEWRLRRLLGSILLDLGRVSPAVEAYRSAVALEPGNVRSAFGLGAALEASGDEEEAFGHYLATGERFGRAGLPWEAIPFLKRAIELRADDAGARNALGSAYMTAGMREQALEQFRAAIELDSQRFEPWHNLAIVADGLGLRAEAIEAYTRFIELAPPALQQPISRARGRIEALTRDSAR
jgi:Flp pilus assembly protein TadD